MEIVVINSTMSEKAKETQKGKISTTGDGLSKKDRRALRVAEKDGSNKANNTQQSTEAQPNKSKNKATKKVEIKTSKQDVENKIGPVIIDITSIAKEKHVGHQKADSTTKKEYKGATDSATLNKTQLKAERRTLQEKQRITKASADPSVVKTPTVTTKKTLQQKSDAKPKLVAHSQTNSTINRHQVPLFNHLYTDSTAHATFYGVSPSVVVAPTGVHAAFARLAVQYASRTVIGSNARCIALMEALKQLVMDHVTPPKQDLCRSLEQAVQTCIDYLQNNSRKLSVSMSNAIRHFKLRLTQIDTNLDDSEKKHILIDCIDSFVQEDIGKAGEAISISVRDKIKDGDVILTYGCSSLIQRILLDAHAKKPSSFRCIIVDSRPLFEGRHTMRILAQAGIPCTYTLINGVCSIIGCASRVLVGAHALLANGSVMARTGTAQVAMVATRCNKPVMVCCETYKFCERAQVDSYVYNELGEPDALAHLDSLSDNVGDSPLRKWKYIPCLTPLNLMYDVTPPDYVTAVVTELGMLPCTSVPVILRVKQTDIA